MNPFRTHLCWGRSLLLVSLVCMLPSAYANELNKDIDPAKQLSSLDRKLARLAKKMEKRVSPWFKNIDVKTEKLRDLNLKRNLALSLIYNEKTYYKRGSGVVGHEDVDKAVDPIRTLWKPLSGALDKDTKDFLKLKTSKAKKELATWIRVNTERETLAAQHSKAGLNVSEAPTVTSIALLALEIRAEKARPMVGNKLWLNACLQRIFDKTVADQNKLSRTAYATGVNPTKAEYDLVRINNDYRRMMGRHPLKIDCRIVAAARGHAQEMERLDYFEHESPIPDRKSPSQRGRLEGYPKGLAENIAKTGGAASAHRLWYGSPGHHRNMLNAAYREIGCGSEMSLWVMNLGR